MFLGDRLGFPPNHRPPPSPTSAADRAPGRIASLARISRLPAASADEGFARVSGLLQGSPPEAPVEREPRLPGNGRVGALGTRALPEEPPRQPFPPLPAGDLAVSAPRCAWGRLGEMTARRDTRGVFPLILLIGRSCRYILDGTGDLVPFCLLGTHCPRRMVPSSFCGLE